MVICASDLSEQTARPLGVERSARTGTGALSEQLNRSAGRNLLEARVRSNHGQRSEAVGHLAVDPQRLATRRENSKPRSRAVNAETRSATADTTCSQSSITSSTSRSVSQLVSASS